MGSVESLAANWEEFARRDPLWSICTKADAKDGRWELDQFFGSGKRRYRDLVAEPAARLGLPRAHHDAIDFGCGVGRFTQAIADDYEHVLGIDISPSMVEQARQFAEGNDRLAFEVNQRATLDHLPTGGFDLVFTHIVLQHTSPALAKGYIAEFCRLIRPGGLVVAQLPHAPRTPEDLPEAARRAEVEVLGPVPATVRSGERFEVPVRLRNPGPSAWTREHALGGLGVGNHWLSPSGDVIEFDDGRSYLATALAPGESADLVVACTAPSVEREAVLRFQAIQEGTAWLEGLSADHTIAIQGSLPDEPAAPPAAASTEPVMEMHAVPRDEVVAVIADAGAELLEIRDDNSSGLAWTSSIYYVTRS